MRCRQNLDRITDRIIDTDHRAVSTKPGSDHGSDHRNGSSDRIIGSGRRRMRTRLNLEQWTFIRMYYIWAAYN